MRRIIVLLFCVLLLTVSCNQGNDQPIVVDFKQGFRGIEIDILDNNPPDEILEQSNFRIAVQIHNRGAYETTVGTVNIVGLSNVLNTIEAEKVLQPLEGRNFNVPDGEFYIEEFQGQNVFIPPGVEEFDVNFWVEVDYDYTAILNTDVCISPSILAIEKNDDVCVIDETMRFSGQGGPVGITRVEEIASTQGDSLQTQFVLTIEERGDGDLISGVNIVEVRVANKRANCNLRELEIEDIKNRQNEVVCSVTEPIRGAYTTTLSATLEYTYRTREQGDFTIKNVRNR